MKLTRPSTLLLLGAGLFTGCYSAAFDSGANGVFACEDTSECPDNMECVLRVCVADDGPQLKINGPEGPFQAFAPGTTEFDLAVVDSSNQSFVLGEPGTGDGYVRIWLDGEEIAPITEGDLAQGFGRNGVTIPAPVVGVHRVRVIVVDPAGEPIFSPGASADRVFFVSEEPPMGEEPTPQVAILKPFPKWNDAPLTVRDYFEVATPFELEIASNDFDWTDPSGTDHVDGQHHTHVYLISEYPDCLPGCNNDYVASLKPSASVSNNADIVDGEAGATLPTEPTRLRVTAGLQWNSHTPFPAPSLMEDDWTDDVRDGLVNDFVDIEFFVLE